VNQLTAIANSRGSTDLPSGGSDFLDCSFVYCERVSSWVTYPPLSLGLCSIQPFLFRNKIVGLSIVAAGHHALTRPFIQSPKHNPVFLHPQCHAATTQSQHQHQRIRQFDDRMQVAIANDMPSFVVYGNTYVKWPELGGIGSEYGRPLYDERDLLRDGRCVEGKAYLLFI
jgi:hypothetical protein